MKIFITISRLIVGSLFIVSGLIKCNDTIGFSYKLNDYFAHDVLNMEFLIPYSLALAVFICVVEVVLGVAVLFGLKTKLSTVLILLMMLFFTWLTWYTSSCLEAQDAAGRLGEEFSKNCVKDCGCFGDALKLEPKESFYKDLFLLIFTIPLFIFGIRNKIPKNDKKQDHFYIIGSLILIFLFGVLYIGWWFSLLFSIVIFGIVYLLKHKMKGDWLTLLAAYMLSLAFAYYCLQNLPFTDFRAYKIGDNLQENMTLPPDAQKEISDYTWTYKLNGEEKTLTDRGRGPKEYDEIIGVKTEVVKKGDEPKIQDFTIESEDEDLTQQFLAEDKLVIIVCYSLEKAEAEGMQALKAMTKRAQDNGYPVIGLTASGQQKKKEIQDTYKLDVDFYLCDEKVLKTVVRANPGVIVLEKGTVTQKAHWNDLEDLEF
ncbi:MauE/DoxX family redox-associated membrane protein [Psychroserpens luteolus]|uniref:MauE/DoxX family redox-associated membrane protein n=1 Tax=Psychroserpens luteolus TaxID=2855840 RepID=UPI001E2CDCCE|nr:MauE/DoxX family redox-associated membrane protein [Psychroserpens luteolus]MCD2260375.1 DoxX family membrane protein [Psychroserpens luteolus]